MQRWRRPIPTGEFIRLGRAPRSGWAVPWDALISREHAELQLIDSQLHVRRLEASRNPIYFQDLDTSDFVIKAGEQFRIGRTVFQLVLHDDELAVTRAREIISSIPDLLAEQHINFQGLHCRMLQTELRDAESSLSKQLASKFRRVIVLELSAGVGPDKVFDLDRFLPTAWDRIAQAFELHFDPDTFHPEQITQTLKSEEAAAFCVLDVQLLSEEDLHRLRGLGFTQENHHILYVGNNADLGTIASPVSTSDSGDVAAIISSSTIVGFSSNVSEVPADKRQSALQKILSVSHLGFAPALEALVSGIPECDSTRLFIFTPGTYELRLTASHPSGQNNCVPDWINDSWLSEILRSHGLATKAVVDGIQFISVPLWDSRKKPLGVIQLGVGRQATRTIDTEFLQCAASAFALAVENMRLQSEAIANERLLQELEAARSVQQNLFPNVRPSLNGYEFAEHFEFANSVAGYFLDFATSCPERVVVIVGDVAGKGIPAALLMAQLLAASRVAMSAGMTLTEAMAVVNREACSSMGGQRFATVVFAEIDAASHTLTLVNAGHLSPLLRRANGTVEPLGQAAVGLPVGIASDSSYESISVPFQSGETLLLFTDGVTEAMDPAQKIYGLPRLATCLAATHQNPDELLASITSDIHCFMGIAKLRDDLCLVACARVGIDQSLEKELAAPSVSSG